jgi:hypothetical protein
VEEPVVDEVEDDAVDEVDVVVVEPPDPSGVDSDEPHPKGTTTNSARSSFFRMDGLRVKQRIKD